MALKRGQIHFARMPSTKSSVQHGNRPVLVISNDIGNSRAPTVIVAPITTRHKADLPTHVRVGNGTFMSYKSRMYSRLWGSVVMFEQITTLDKEVLGELVAKTDITTDMEMAILVSLGLEGIE